MSSSSYYFHTPIIDHWNPETSEYKERVLFDRACETLACIYYEGYEDIVNLHRDSQYIAPEIFNSSWKSFFALLNTHGPYPSQTRWEIDTLVDHIYKSIQELYPKK